MLLLLTGALLVTASFVQRSLNVDRDRLGLTRVEPLENAPPVLAFTTVALGGFRGLISNALWIRASDLQDEDKFFEMAQLADWITKLEPHFVHVWLVQAWNMAYNISVGTFSPRERWHWVSAGANLLRDHGLRYNPKTINIYYELAWIYLHKMGDFMDDQHWAYKRNVAVDMERTLGQPPVEIEGREAVDAMREIAQAAQDIQKFGPLERPDLDRGGPALRHRWRRYLVRRGRHRDRVAHRLQQQRHRDGLQPDRRVQRDDPDAHRP